MRYHTSRTGFESLIIPQEDDEPWGTGDYERQSRWWPHIDLVSNVGDMRCHTSWTDFESLITPRRDDCQCRQWLEASDRKYLVERELLEITYCCCTAVYVWYWHPLYFLLRKRCLASVAYGLDWHPHFFLLRSLAPVTYGLDWCTTMSCVTYDLVLTSSVFNCYETMSCVSHLRFFFFFSFTRVVCASVVVWFWFEAPWVLRWL